MKLAFEDVTLNVQEDGDPAGVPLVFANSLGTDLRLWDAILPDLPAVLRIIRWDKRGHGASSVPKIPYSMGALIRDAERICDVLEVRDCMFVGLSIGGMIAQGFARKRPDLVRAMVLSNTAAKIGTRQLWQDRIAAVEVNGLGSIADATMERWFAKGFAEIPQWRARFMATPAQGWCGCAAAIAGTDFYTPTAALRLPTLGIAGSEDGSTPPDLVKETVDTIPGSQFALIRGAGHLPCVEKPKDYANILTSFLRSTGTI